MKWTFVNIRLKKFPTMPTEWVLKISGEWELMEYMRETTDTRVAAAVTDFREVKAGRAHVGNVLNYMADMRAQNKGFSFAQGLVDVLDEVWHNRLAMLKEGKVLYIKGSGGYSYDTVPGTFYDVLGEQGSEELHFPNLEVRYLQWPNGTHWYAKIGDVDIEWKGKQKWDTKADAEYAVRQWKRSKGISPKVGMDSFR